MDGTNYPSQLQQQVCFSYLETKKILITRLLPLLPPQETEEQQLNTGLSKMSFEA